MTYYYLGLRDDGRWEIFAADTADPVKVKGGSGYDDIQGPFFSRAEAEEFMEDE